MSAIATAPFAFIRHGVGVSSDLKLASFRRWPGNWTRCGSSQRNTSPKPAKGIGKADSGFLNPEVPGWRFKARTRLPCMRGIGAARSNPRRC